MFEWIRHEFLMATTDSVYGPHSPLRDPANEEAWHNYHPTIMFLMLDLLPHWAFHIAIKSRNQLAKAFQTITSTADTPKAQTTSGGGPSTLSAGTSPLATSVRIASEDHMLDGKYLIKKGSMVMMPARVQHHFKEVWGENVEVFNARRFMRNPGEPRLHPVAFRGFGGGTPLCLGRHFATTEILLFTAMVLLRFDVLSGGGEGKWIMPATKSLRRRRQWSSRTVTSILS
ncbi:hypothetical protein QC762_0084330 [Podospora pseudocomata]|uniref:Cytochrome P450 E-class, group IV n=1 Tax=Podospora pseudocomata TaxID=2093779 RepID=A0ABR0GD08_9PEZI|nr:hypothetical protein QC762_0084330 [Podospora pseudocomata]